MVVNLSNKLKEMRTRRGLTQKELADKIGVTESYICQIENGKMISIKKLSGGQKEARSTAELRYRLPFT